jgi:cytidine deaminase
VSDDAFDPQALLDVAQEAREQAYAPYSRFRVGAALLTTTGTIYRGCNVENVSYGLTICAERVAIQTAIAAGERAFKAVAIMTGAATPASPCGACRQVLAEFGGGLQVILPGADGAAPTVRPLSDYLPFGFDAKDLASGQDNDA